MVFVINLVIDSPCLGIAKGRVRAHVGYFYDVRKRVSHCIDCTQAEAFGMSTCSDLTQKATPREDVQRLAFYTQQ